MHIFGQIWAEYLALFGPKNLGFTEGSKSFGTHITEKPPRHLVWIVFWLGKELNGPKIPIFGQNAKFGLFWAKNPNIYGSK